MDSAGSVYRELWRRLEPSQRWGLAGMIALAVLSSLLELVLVGVTAVFGSALLNPTGEFLGRKWLLQLQPGADPQDLLLGAAALTFAGILARGLIGLYKTWADARYTAGCFRTISTAAFAQVLRRPYRWHIEHEASALLKAIHEDMWAVHLLLVQGINICSDSLIILLIVGVLAQKSGLVVMGCLAGLGGLGLGLHRTLHRVLRGFGATELEANQQAIALASQGVVGIKDVQVLGAQPMLEEAFTDVRRRLEELRARSEVARAAPRQALEIIAYFGLLVATVLVTRRVDPGAATSTLALLGVGFIRLMPAVNRLLTNLAVVSHQLPAASEALNLFPADTPPPRPPAGPERIQELALHDVRFTYPTGTRPALEQISLTLTRPGQVGLVGRSGGGKTTLADLLCGLLTPDSGTLAVNGRPLTGPLHEHYRVGYVAQHPFLLDASIAQNVALSFHSPDEARVWECLRTAQLDETVRALPEGLKARVGERGVRLSGGQAQRLAIARSLYQDPDLLVLDEATSALDNPTEVAFMATLQGLSVERLVVIIAHRMSTVQGCDIIYVMDEGRVVAQGAHAELLDSSPAYRGLVGGEASRA